MHRTTLPNILALAALLASASGASAQTKPVITLAEAIERARRVQPLVVSAIGQLHNADARLRSAKGAYLPNLNVTGSAGDFYSEGQRIDPSTGQLTTSNTTNRSINGSINSSIEVFDGFRRSAESKAAKANRASAEANLTDAQYQQELATTNQFYDVLAGTQLLRVRQASVRRAEEQLKVAIARLRAGAAIRPDSLRSLVTLGTARLDMINAQTQLLSAEANLGRLVGSDGPVGAVDDSSFYATAIVIDTAAVRAEALAQSPQVVAAEASARSARAALGVVKAAYWPSVTLSGSSSLNGSRQNNYSFLQQRQLQFGLNWAVFNRFTREQNIVNQRSTAEIAEANAAELRRQVLADLTTRLAELGAAQERIAITQVSVVAATEDLRVQQERYRLGAATIVDVLTSQEALNQAEVDAVNARFDHLRAKAQIQALIGRPL
ncbi:MAG: TolC family protein [Gemmatimonadota bacterium]